MSRLLQVDDDRKEGSLIALLEPGAEQAFVGGLSPFIIAEKVYFEAEPEVATWLLAGMGIDGVLEGVGAALPGPDLYEHVATHVAGRPLRGAAAVGAAARVGGGVRQIQQCFSGFLRPNGRDG